MKLKEALQITNDNITNERRMMTLISSKLTREVFKEIEYQPVKLQEFHEIFITGNVNDLRHWLNKIIDPELGELGVRALRKVAATHLVPFYYRLTKLELIQEINNAKKTNVRSDTQTSL